MLKELSQMNDWIVHCRRELHQHPEIGMELPWTMDFIKEILTTLGLEVKDCGGGVYVDIEGYAPGRLVALRADCDALQVKEETGASYASLNENMHACGHDGHASMLLGACKYLSEHRDFKGTIRLFFQPDEEGGTGALSMIEAGVLHGVDFVFGLHGGTISTELPPGKIGFKKGPMMASVDHLHFRVKGKGCHAAYPHLGRDPVVCAGEFILGVQTLISREKNALEPAVLSLPVIHAGRASNVIPDEVYMEGTLRCFNEELRQRLHRRIKEYLEHLCLGKGVEGHYHYDELIYPLVNADDVVEKGLKKVGELLGNQVVELQEPVFGGEDFAYYLKDTKGCFFSLIIRKEQKKGIQSFIHQPLI